MLPGQGQLTRLQTVLYCDGLLLLAAAVAWLLAYIICHLDVIALRRRYPDLARPFKTPFYPLPQLVGILGMGYVALNNSPSPEMTQTVYSLTGVVLLISRGSLEVLLGLSLNTGDLWMLVAVLTWSIYTVGLQWRPKGVHPMLQLAAFIFVGLLVMARTQPKPRPRRARAHQ